MFERLIRIVGEKCFHKIQNAHIALVGVGGVGGYVLECLVRSGISHITIYDFDIIEETNLNRQIIATTKNIGKSKAMEALERVKMINPSCEVLVEDIRVIAGNFDFQRYDYVIDACDDVVAKIAMIQHCFSLDIPFISCMGTGNRMHPEMLQIMPLAKTQMDPLARKIRNLLRKENPDYLSTLVLCSNEKPVQTEKLGTFCAVPMAAGALLASYVIQSIIKSETV